MTGPAPDAPVVGIVGLGYVGLPLAVAFLEAGSAVIGVDADADVVADLAAGRSRIEDVPDAVLARLAGAFAPTTDAAALIGADAILLCVPTPLTANREPDLSMLDAAVVAVSAVARAGQLIVLESTSYPGTTRERVAPVLERAGLRVGEDIHVAFSPERVDPGRTDHTLRTTPKVVAGVTDACRDRALELYARVCDVLVPVSSTEVAEASKLLENVFRAVNIALVNELALLADRMGFDVWETVEAAATKPFGFMRFDPGPGMGGHCLPVDPFYLAWRAREFGLSAEFVELAGKVNRQMPLHCAERAARLLNDAGLPVRGTEVLVVGVSYKPGIGDLREAPALAIIDELTARGARIAYHDPHVPTLPGRELESVALEDGVRAAALVIVVTAHPSVDHHALAERAERLLDLRGVTRGSGAEGVVRL